MRCFDYLDVIYYCIVVQKLRPHEKMKPRVRNCHTCQPSCFDQPFSGSEWHPNAEVVLSFLIGMCLGGDNKLRLSKKFNQGVRNFHP